MLALSRQCGERLICDVPLGFSGPIEFKIVQIRGDKVRCGIIAPKEVNIRRGELEDERKFQESAT